MATLENVIEKLMSIVTYKQSSEMAWLLVKLESLHLKQATYMVKKADSFIPFPLAMQTIVITIPALPLGKHHSLITIY